MIAHNLQRWIREPFPALEELRIGRAFLLLEVSADGQLQVAEVLVRQVRSIRAGAEVAVFIVYSTNSEELQPGETIERHVDLKAVLALEYSMFVMAAPLAFFGAATGFMAGMYLNRTERLHQLLLEQEKSTASLEAVKALSATLSHYLLNANMIIGGKVRHCRRIDPPQDILDSLRIIEEQGRIIDAVVGALGEVARVAIIHGTFNQIPMIDLTREIGRAPAPA